MTKIKENHNVAELICINCKYRYIGVYPEDMALKGIVCDGCDEYGYIIMTGEDMNDEQ